MLQVRPLLPTSECTRPPRRTARWNKRCAGPGEHPVPRVESGTHPATGKGWNPAVRIHWPHHLVRTFFNTTRLETQLLL